MRGEQSDALHRHFFLDLSFNPVLSANLLPVGKNGGTVRRSA